MMHLPAEYLGNAIRRARLQMKWSQDQLADASTVEVRTISNIERNVGNPTFENLFSLIRVLKIDAREIFNYEELHNAPTAYHLQQMLLGCTEEEAQSLTDVSEVVLKAMRRTHKPTSDR